MSGIIELWIGSLKSKGLREWEKGWLRAFRFWTFNFSRTAGTIDKHL